MALTRPRTDVPDSGEALGSRPGPRPWIVPAAAGGYLLLAFAAVFAVDVRGAFGGPTRFAEAGLDPPYVWFQLFMDGGLTELAQWGLLAALVIIAARFAAMHRLETGPEAARLAAFWGLFAVFAALLLVEDAGNPRHLLHHYAGVMSGFDPLVTSLVEIAYFGAIAALGCYAFLRHGRALASMPGVRSLGLAGVVAYALAVGLSATRTIGLWYHDAGSWLVDRVLRAPQMVEAVPVTGLDPWDLRFFFMDFVVEESLELLGAAFLVAAALAFARHRRGRT